MHKELFKAVDAYIERLFVPPDPALDATLHSIEAGGLPPIQISAVQGKFLYLLARLVDARRILEIGTLAGYSTIWLARALPPNGRLISLEADPKHVAAARDNLSAAGLAEQVEVVEGAALATLPEIEARGDGPFDLVFIDADKPAYRDYLDWSLRLVRPGGLILADNVVRGGAVLEPAAGDAAAQGTAAFNQALADNPGLDAMILQQVGPKGHDGLALAVVRG